jgi:hypothetical protein
MCGAFIYRIFRTDALQYYTNKRGNLFFNVQPKSIFMALIFFPFYIPPQSRSSKKVCKKINFRSGNIRGDGQR